MSTESGTSLEWGPRGLCCHHMLSHWVVGSDSWRKNGGRSWTQLRWGEVSGQWLLTVLWNIFGIFLTCTITILLLVNLYNPENVPPLLGKQLGWWSVGWTPGAGHSLQKPYRQHFLITVLTGSGGGVCISALPWGWHAVFMLIPKRTYTEQSQGSLLYYITWAVIILGYYGMVSCYNTGHGHMFCLNYLRKTLVQPPSPKLMIWFSCTKAKFCIMLSVVQVEMIWDYFGS